jgi:hypothetical protein
VIADPKDYIRSAVKIEAGANWVLDPHEATTVKPYIAVDLSDLDLAVRNVTTVKPERTFWDKIIILHGPRRYRPGCQRYLTTVRAALRLRSVGRATV